MEGRYFDGRRSTPHLAEVARVGDALEIRADGQVLTWSIRRLKVEALGREARLSHPSARDARLVLSDEAFRTLLGDGESIRSRARRRELVLVGGLVALGVGTVALLFVGVPAASGPLARATPIEYEAQLGRNYETQLGFFLPACGGAEGQAVLADIGARLGDASESPFEIRVWAVRHSMVNAMALPGGAVLVTQGLIDSAESPDEVVGVIAHEVAHVEKRHVMQAVWRAVGLGMLLDLLVGGGTGAGQQAVLLAGSMSEMNYSREAETEADSRGRELLHALGLSSEGMAAFFRRMAESEKKDRKSAQKTEQSDELGRVFPAAVEEWFNTHPATDRRLKAADAEARPGAPSMTTAQWAAVKATCAPVEQ